VQAEHEADRRTQIEKVRRGVHRWPFGLAWNISSIRSVTPWIAFAPDISGVCRVAGTFEMTSNPPAH
jgi:hypothetical protein